MALQILDLFPPLYVTQNALFVKWSQFIYMCKCIWRGPITVAKTLWNWKVHFKILCTHLEKGPIFQYSSSCLKTTMNSSSMFYSSTVTSSSIKQRKFLMKNQIFLGISALLNFLAHHAYWLSTEHRRSQKQE